MKIRELYNLFTEDCQFIRLYDLANDSEICFEGQISEATDEYDDNRIIIIETMIEEYFDGYLCIYIATENEDEYYEKYNEE